MADILRFFLKMIKNDYLTIPIQFILILAIFFYMIVQETLLALLLEAEKSKIKF